MDELQICLTKAWQATNHATMLLNSLIDVLFTKHELATSQGLGVRPRGMRRTEATYLDPVKVAAIKGEFILLFFIYLF